MDKVTKALPIIAALFGGIYLGYYFTSGHYARKDADRYRSENTAICRLELRDGNRGDTKAKYIGILEYRSDDKELCEEHMPLDELPNDTNITTLNGLRSEDDYDDQ